MRELKLPLRLSPANARIAVAETSTRRGSAAFNVAVKPVTNPAVGALGIMTGMSSGS
jgi:hypothetical protein